MLEIASDLFHSLFSCHLPENIPIFPLILFTTLISCLWVNVLLISYSVFSRNKQNIICWNWGDNEMRIRVLWEIILCRWVPQVSNKRYIRKVGNHSSRDTTSYPHPHVLSSYEVAALPSAQSSRMSGKHCLAFKCCERLVFCRPVHSAAVTSEAFAFYVQNLFMSSVWFSELTAITSLYPVNEPNNTDDCSQHIYILL